MTSMTRFLVVFCVAALVAVVFGWIINWSYRHARARVASVAVSGPVLIEGDGLVGADFIGKRAIDEAFFRCGLKDGRFRIIDGADAWKEGHRSWVRTRPSPEPTQPAILRLPRLMPETCS